jgi:hypothetical protein
MNHDKRNDDAQEPLDLAHSYFARGLSVLPVEYRGKRPAHNGKLLSGWQRLRLTAHDLPAYFNGQPQNVGALLGEPSGGLVDVDLDCAAAVLLAPAFLPATGATFGRTSKRRSHYLYYANLTTRKFRDPLLESRKGAAEQEKAMLLELRSTGAQTVFPGSTHESGEPITWDEDGEPARVEAKVLERGAARLAAASLLARYWPGGSRNDAANALAGGLLRAGWAVGEVEQFVGAVCRAAQDEETQARVRAVADTAAKLRAGESVTGWPTLAEIIDKRLFSRVCEWLEIRNAAAAQDKATDAGGGAAQDDVPLRVVCMADVAPEQVTWLWFPYVARGKLTLLEGDPGLGKSWLTCALACAVSRGQGLPGAEPFTPGTVLMLSAEDGLGDTLRPRLDAVGADVTRVFALAEPVTLDAAGLLRLEAAIIEHKPDLVIIDPLFAYTGGKVDIHRANECRAVSAPLAAIAERHGCAIVAVRHLGKSRGGGHALNAGIGSIDFTAAARSVLLVGRDPDDEQKRALVQTKNNLAPIGEAVGYKLEGGQFFWTGASDLTAGRILAAESDEGERTSITEAVEFLTTALSGGARDSKAVKDEARGVGISEATLRRAKARLKVQARKVGLPGSHCQKWVWQLPGSEGAQECAEGAQRTEDEHLRASGADKDTYSQHLAEDDHGSEFEHLRAEACASSAGAEPLSDEEAELAARLEYMEYVPRAEAERRARERFAPVPF